jgi:N utilization substance protein A
VKEVRLDELNGSATVVVSDHQLSLAIGREGQNARLAARLTGWRVDLRSESELAARAQAGDEPADVLMEGEWAEGEWAEGEWVEDENGEMVWQPAEGGAAVTASEWAQAEEGSGMLEGPGDSAAESEPTSGPQDNG